MVIPRDAPEIRSLHEWTEYNMGSASSEETHARDTQ